MKIPVLISVPTSPSSTWTHKSVNMVVSALEKDPRYAVTPMWPSHNPYENNLHQIIEDFINGPWYYWLTIDADNPPRRNPLDLIQLDKDIIGFPTPVWHHSTRDKKTKGERPFYWNVYKRNKKGWTEWPVKNGLQKVDAVGSGCVLFSKRVFLDPKMREAPFARITLPDGRVDTGCDLAFCDRANARGYEIWTHWDYPCGHFIELDLLDVIESFHNWEKSRKRKRKI